MIGCVRSLVRIQSSRRFLIEERLPRGSRFCFARDLAWSSNLRSYANFQPSCERNLPDLAHVLAQQNYAEELL